MQPLNNVNRSGSYMSRRVNMQSHNGNRPAGMETSNILDTKYNMLRQRGQLKSEGGGFMR